MSYRTERNTYGGYYVRDRRGAAVACIAQGAGGCGRGWRLQLFRLHETGGDIYSFHPTLRDAKKRVAFVFNVEVA
jgi:hypothetical protein